MLQQDKQQNIILQKMTAAYSRARLWSLILIVILLATGLAVYHHWKVLPEGLAYRSQDYIVNLSDLQLLVDRTYQNQSGQSVSEQKIFDRIFNYIDGAEQYILVDMFLFNDFGVGDKLAGRALSSELTAKLLAKKQMRPDIRIDVLTDPINTVYGGVTAANLAALQAAGINVIITDLRPLRDSNWLYSGWWRLFFAWWGNSTRGWLPAPFGIKNKVTVRSYTALLNFKANHRKVFIADQAGRLVSVVGSANPHDGSSRHSNIALGLAGQAVAGLYTSETAVAALSGAGLNPLPENLLQSNEAGENKYATVRVLTEGRIKEAALAIINGLQADDKLLVAMFYLSDRKIVNALVQAVKRDVSVRLILDPNRDAFGYEKNGIPNRPVAAELWRRTQGRIGLRWYRTQGEQFHPKMMLAFNNGEQTADLLLGSANFTKRNLGDFNLETDLWLTTRQDLSLAQEAKLYFDDLWSNRGGNFTADYEEFKDPSWPLFFTYWLQETSGLSSF